MALKCIPQLEKLISGKLEQIDIQRTSETTRDLLLRTLNNVILLNYPGTWTSGKFMDSKKNDYLIYDVQVLGNEISNLTSFRMVEFNDLFTICRI